MSALQCIYIDAQGGEVVRLDLMLSVMGFVH